MRMGWTRHTWLVAALGMAGGCSSGSAPELDAGVDGGVDAAVALPWDKGLPSTSSLYPQRRGWRDVRGIVHLHSVYSHDACDGRPREGGMPSQPCHDHLRSALCQTRQDFTMLTDHDDSMADGAWDDLFLPRPGDEPVLVGGKHVASWLGCEGSGHRVLLQIGSENETMPLGLEGHVSDDLVQRHALLNGTDAVAVAALRAQGALIAFAHTESKSLELLRQAGAEAVEIYNLHASLDPKIRTAMGMDAAAHLVRIGPFLQNRPDGPEPDLAFLAVAEDLPAELTKWNTLLSEGRRVTGTAGSDAHENALQQPMADGERGDSYRRVMRWFSNHLLVSAVTPADVKQALRSGRGYALFELLGPAQGFDVRAEANGVVTELGGEVALAESPVIVVDPPRTVGGEALLVRLVLADRPEGSVVATSDGTAPLRYSPTKPGAYRVEVRMTPHHLRPYLAGADKQLVREMPWIYANPIWVN
jgi:hypothetical protein